MATGLAMFDALKQATRGLPPQAIFEINFFDACDLMRLSTDDLLSRGFDRERAGVIAADLADHRLDELGRALNLILAVNSQRRNLIPGEGFRRAAEELKDDPRSLEEILEECDRIRHPERYPA